MSTSTSCPIQRGADQAKQIIIDFETWWNREGEELALNQTIPGVIGWSDVKSIAQHAWLNGAISATRRGRMTAEEINVAIAEACGRKKIDPPKDQGWGQSAKGKSWWYVHQLPNYVGDLNAMHEAESILTFDQVGTFESHLHRIVHEFLSQAPKQDALFYSSHTFFLMAHAGAAKRAEAFLRTIGKWKENS